MAVDRISPGAHDRRVREWLLLLLRFAITREAGDRSAVCQFAVGLDSSGLHWLQGGPSFFLRTSRELCVAIAANGSEPGNTVLRRHISRIDDPRLKRAFAAALGMEQATRPAQRVVELRPKHAGLWKGLASK